MMNEIGDSVPHDVARAAQRYHCNGGVLYVYKDGKYGSKFPAASIGGFKAARFRSYSYEAYKVRIAAGWVAFRSPSASNPRH